MKTNLFLPTSVAISRYEKSYDFSHGIYYTHEKKLHSIDMECVLAEDYVMKFLGEGHELHIRFEEKSNAEYYYLESEDKGYSYEFRFPSVKDEYIFGGGEQFREINLRGHTVHNFVSEHIRGRNLIKRAALPQFLYKPLHAEQLPSYAVMPVFVTSKNRLIWFDTPSIGFSYFGDDYYSFRFDSCPQKIVVLHGNNLSELLQAFNEIIPNRQYLPEWCYDGLIFAIQGGTKKMLNKAISLKRAGAKVAGVWCQDWSGKKITVFGRQVLLSWDLDKKDYCDLKRAIRALNEESIKFIGYNTPRISDASKYYKIFKEKGFFVTHKDGTVYHVNSTTFGSAIIDLTNPEAVEFTKKTLLKNMLDLGMSGWLSDFGEYLPMDCVLHNGDPAELHNLWPVIWAKVNREAIEEYGQGNEFFISRSGYTGVQKYASIFWAGDQFTDTSLDYGMPSVIPASLSLGLSGITAVHSDVGGFWALGPFLCRNKDLFVRWMEMNAFSPLFRTHESIFPWTNIQCDWPIVKKYTIKFSEIHSQLAPYLKECMTQAQKGIPVMRPDFWEHSDDLSHHDEYSYYLGEDLFVAPVIQRFKRKRRVYLPEGIWIHLWSMKEYKGNQEYIIKAPLGEPPVFYRLSSKYVELFEKIYKENVNEIK